ncbi:DUF4380 domain-containing protein [Patulibacter sp. S7RM1-6]
MSGRVRHDVDADGPDAVHWLRAGALELGIVPALGARLLALRWDGRELLYRNARLVDERLHRTAAEAALPPVDATMGSWRNYGGDKTWPAPQGWSGPGEWAGPPDPVLDSGAWEADVSHDEDRVVLDLRSAADPRTGLRLRRRFVVGPDGDGFALELGMENASAAPVTWSLWNVTQVAGGRDPQGGLHVGVDADHPSEPVVELLAGTGVPRWAHVADGHVLVPDQDVVGKLGVPAASGWLAYASEGLLLTQTFPVDRGAAYPDRGSRVEAWLEHPLDAPLRELGDLQPRDRVVECEVLGPRTTLAPGERAALRIDVAVQALADPSPAGVRAAVLGPERKAAR